MDWLLQLEPAAEAESADTADEQAWALTRSAAALRKAGRFDEALTALDAAGALDASEWTRRALSTCAVAVHCDRDEPELAVRIGAEQMERSLDEKLLHAMTRAYCEAFEATGRDVYCEQWRRISAVLEEGRLPASDGRRIYGPAANAASSSSP